LGAPGAAVAEEGFVSTSTASISPLNNGRKPSTLKRCAAVASD
jgi:hypothetical protein